MFLLFKYLITAGCVVLISELAKRSDKLGGSIASLPIVTILVMIWLHWEHQSPAKISNHAYYTFWYVIPTLPMFLIFPSLHSHIGFWYAMLSCVLITLLLFVMWVLILKPFGIHLL